MLKNENIYIHNVLEIIPFIWVMLHLTCDLFLASVSNFCFIAKQRIDSGFFLFEADRKKKEEKQEKFEEVKWSHGIIGWWLYVNKFAIFFQNFPFRMTNSYVIVIDLEAKNPPYNLDLVISGLLLLLAPVGSRFWPNFQENLLYF